jgi:protein-arginine kinase activator protein McsA
MNQIDEILNKIIELKYLLVQALDFESAAAMRDMEKKYLEKKDENKTKIS